VLRDAVVNRTEEHELLAITHSPAVIGEELSLDLMGAGRTLTVKVRVVESRPVIVEGTVRHRVRLALPEQVAADPIETVLAAEPQPLSEPAVSMSESLGALTLRVAEAG